MRKVMPLFIAVAWAFTPSIAHGQRAARFTGRAAHVSASLDLEENSPPEAYNV